MPQLILRWIMGVAAVSVILAGVAPPHAWSEQESKLVAKPAPNFKLKDIAGKEWQLSKLKGKKIAVLDFGATACIPCRFTVTDLEKIHQAYKGRGVQVLTICLNARSPQTVRDFVSEMKLTYPVLADVEFKAAEAYRVQVIPFTVIVGKDGVVRWTLKGHPEDYRQLVQAQLDALLPAQ